MSDAGDQLLPEGRLVSPWVSSTNEAQEVASWSILQSFELEW